MSANPYRPSGYRIRRAVNAGPSLRERTQTIRRERFAPLCPPCQQGDHSMNHDDVLGCTELVGREPGDFICSCSEPRQ